MPLSPRQPNEAFGYHQDNRVVPFDDKYYFMATPSSLQTQLLARVKTFQDNFPSITQADIARHCGIGEANFSAAIAGRRGLSANSVLQLHRLLSLPKNEVIAKFSTPVRSSKIVGFQSLGRPMRLDNSGWVAREGGTDDPVNSGSDITSTPRAVTQQVADLVSVFQGLDYVTRKSVIDSFIQAHASANIVPTSQKFNRGRS
jgi:hypothetical protein